MKSDKILTGLFTALLILLYTQLYFNDIKRIIGAKDKEDLMTGEVTKEYEYKYFNPLEVVFIGEIPLNSEHHTLVFSVGARIVLLFQLVILGWLTFSFIRWLARSAMDMTTVYLVGVTAVGYLYYSLWHAIQLMDIEKSEVISYAVLSLPYLLLLVSIAFLVRFKKLNSQEEIRSDLPSYIGTRYANWGWDRIAWMLLNASVLIYYLRSMGTESLPDSENESPTNFIFLSFWMVFLIGMGLMEWATGSTWGKWLSGYVVRTEDGKPLGAKHVFMRTLSRFIPLDSWSYLFRGNWHDRISATRLVYVSSRDWMQQQLGWMRRFSMVILVISIVFFLSSVMTIVNYESDYFSGRLGDREFTHFYGMIGVFALVVFWVLQSGWLAGLRSYSDRAYGMDESESAGYLFTALCSWLPVVGYFIAGQSTRNIESGLKQLYSVRVGMSRLKRRGTTTRIWFNVFLTFYGLAWISLISETNRFGVASAWVMTSLFFMIYMIVWCMYLREMNKYTEQNESSDQVDETLQMDPVS